MAAQNGAVCYLSEEEIPGTDLPYILVSDVRKAQSVLARWFYDDPSRAFCLAGVTGTKGKTTTTHMIHGVMDAVEGQDTGYLSGIEHFAGGEVYAAHLSTPESLELQKLYAEARDNALPFVTSEISSQAYKVERVFGQHFDYGVFLNISPDHISPYEHPDMDDYLACKTALLRNSTVAIICRDTDYFDRVYAAALEDCEKVYLIHRRDVFSAAKTAVDSVLKKKNVTVLTNSVIEEIKGESAVSSIILKNRANGSTAEIPLSAVFVAIGLMPDNKLYEGVLKLDDRGYFDCDEDCVTDCEGVFVAGDTRKKVLRQLVTAASDGATAANAAANYIRKNF